MCDPEYGWAGAGSACVALEETALPQAGPGDPAAGPQGRQHVRTPEGICMPVATLHDGSTIAIEVHGAGPALLLPVNPQPVTGPQAEVMRQWGADPALGASLIAGLRDVFRVVAFDYEGHLLRTPLPDSLTPANAVSDLLAIAAAAGADRFAYYGYSWLALI